jgi:2-methylcitrate dehydratase PrpD
VSYSRHLAVRTASGLPGPAARAEAQRDLAALGSLEAGAATEAAFAAGLRTGLAVAAAAAAAGLLQGASDADVVEAAAAGLEAGREVEAALATSPDRRPWASGSVAAWIGSAAAAGRVLGLDPDRQLAAIALATTQANAIDRDGSDRLRHAKAAFDGVEAALLAEAGFTAPEAPIEGRRGLAALTAPGAALPA